jgi:hypothetical protein
MGLLQGTWEKEHERWFKIVTNTFHANEDLSMINPVLLCKSELSSSLGPSRGVSDNDDEKQKMTAVIVCIQCLQNASI